eukprot:1195561-Prorocentrum_minimum.AAC.2
MARVAVEMVSGFQGFRVSGFGGGAPRRRRCPARPVYRGVYRGLSRFTKAFIELGEVGALLPDHNPEQLVLQTVERHEEVKQRHLHGHGHRHRVPEYAPPWINGATEAGNMLRRGPMAQQRRGICSAVDQWRNRGGNMLRRGSMAQQRRGICSAVDQWRNRGGKYAPPRANGPHLHGHLGRVVRVAVLGSHVEPKVGMVRDEVVAHLDHVAAALLEYLLQKQRLQGGVQRLANVLQDHRAPEAHACVGSTGRTVRGGGRRAAYGYPGLLRGRLCIL